MKIRVTAFLDDSASRAVADVLDVIAQETQWLKVSRAELRRQLRRARRLARTRYSGSRVHWRSLMSDLSTLLDRSVEPVFDAALAVAEFGYDVRVSCKRVWSRL